tara:strand:+ start:1459 stop:2295 length:837 start_codon:yes stop_codon:yes gene_type:complete
MKEIFDQSSYKISKLITNEYSTSFSTGIYLFDSKTRPTIYAIYGFVRYADEIVDTFNDYNQSELLTKFIQDYEFALKEKISLNPILNSFQEVVNKFGLHTLVNSFLESMKMDLEKSTYLNKEELEKYIYGSADVVGLMCLKVFVKGDEKEYQKLSPYAMKLGSAFQKVNFLRDIKHDKDHLGRSYFPEVNFDCFSEEQKRLIIEDIKEDFNQAVIGIKQLPSNCRLGVYVAYKYYLSLLNKISVNPAEQVLNKRTRIPNYIKLYLLNKAYIRYQINAL